MSKFDELVMLVKSKGWLCTETELKKKIFIYGFPDGR